MAMSKARTVAEYLRELDADRRKVIAAVRKVVNDHLPDGYQEAMNFGMICWHVPLKTFPDTYNGQPLCYAALSAQKNHNSLYLMGVYGDPSQSAALADAFRKRGKKLDMGKSCVRFKALDDLPLDLIGEVVARTPPSRMIALHDEAHGRHTTARPPGRKVSTRSVKPVPRSA
jgi:hypothetical protein